MQTDPLCLNTDRPPALMETVFLSLNTDRPSLSECRHTLSVSIQTDPLCLNTDRPFLS